MDGTTPSPDLRYGDREIAHAHTIRPGLAGVASKRSPSRRLATLLLCAAVIVAWVIAQLLIIGHGRYFDWWDESVYVSQITPGGVPTSWAAHRARGPYLLVAPILRAGGGVEAMRLYLMVVMAVAMLGAAWAWVRSIGRSAAIGTFLFAFSWLAVFYASIVSPNLPAAIAALGSVGVLARWTSRPATPLLVVLGLLVGATALFRPIDALMLCAALGLIAATWRSRRTITVWLTLGLGWIMGAIPFFVDASRRGGIAHSLSEARQMTGVGNSFSLIEHLRLTDGPAMGPDPSSGVPWPALAWWSVLLFFAFGAVVGERRAPKGERPATYAGFAATLLILPYLFTAASAPRFLLPGYALLSFAAAVGLHAFVLRSGSAVLGGIAAAMLIALAGWHLSVANEANSREERSSETGRRLGVALDKVTEPPCVFSSPYGLPPIQLTSGCQGYVYRQGPWQESASTMVDPNMQILDSAHARGEPVFVLAPKSFKFGPVIRAWVKRPVPTLPRWVIYTKDAAS